MRRPALALSLAVAISAAAARADSPTPLAAPVAPASAATAPAVAAPRAASTGTTAKLAAGLPKFIARPAASSNPAPVATEPVDLREIDKPRNSIIRLPNFAKPPSAVATSAPGGIDAPGEGVIRLPNYDVRDRRQPALKNRELLTPEGKIALEFKRHPGLHIGNLFGLNRGIAAMMAAEDDAYERRIEMEDLVGFQQFVAKLPPPKTETDSAPPAAVTK